MNKLFKKTFAQSWLQTSPEYFINGFHLLKIPPLEIWERQSENILRE